MPLDQEAQLRQCLDLHQAMVFSIALRLLGDAALAEEVAQDVFLELHAWLPRLESAEHVKFWLRRVATHRATDALRRRRRRPESGGEMWEETHEAAAAGGASAAPAYRRSAGDVHVPLERMLLSLPEAQRVAIVLRYGEDLLPEEIAEVTGQPLPTVKSHLQRGLALLRRKGAVVLKEFVRG